ncbi:MarR family winged helix-turn-helix transcriptional regulator [Zhihengliuella halotolerans]|uniref:MarR family transcriptional regulator n=1 Tax=Zhihengliuella halotolerans TaxID=370736 RepID=A0A4Q8ACV4_9MICC|nr:MarR family transcriptional regulator [Zhihengliuella halotolerans]RZU61924.1 MarR family transcriptional regulator [Zhihengliuella halotolerans]
MPETPARDPLSLDAQLCFPVYASQQRIAAAYRELLAPLSLTYPQYLVLLVLWESDGVLVSEIGDRLHLDSGTLSPLLKRMAAAGLVERRRDDADERRVRIHLTEAGAALRQRAAGIPAELFGRLGLTIDEAERLRGLLAKLCS